MNFLLCPFSDTKLTQTLDFYLGTQPQPSLTPYQGPWTPQRWRQAVVDALIAVFGADSVDTSGRVAINISAVEGSRPSADVVPSFLYRRFDNPDRTIAPEGSCVFPTVNRPGFDAASFFVKDEAYVEALPGRAT